MAAGPGEHAERQTSGWITTGLHESVASLSRRPDLEPAGPALDRPIAPALLGRLQCPDCRGPLVQAVSALRCTGCNATFPTEFGVPILHATRTPDEAAARAEAVQRLCESDATRAAWRVEHVLGSPLRHRGLWPAE
jgi:uncharacterized protein YbaR (Trm112 family)